MTISRLIFLNEALWPLKSTRERNMYANALFVAHRSNPVGVYALDILQRTLRQRTRLLTGDDIKVPEDSVAFVLTDAARFPNRCFRILPQNAASERTQKERNELVKLMPWLESTRAVIAIAPRHVYGGQVIERIKPSFESGLAHLVGYRRQRYSDPTLSPLQKKERNMAARRKLRKENEFLIN